MANYGHDQGLTRLSAALGIKAIYEPKWAQKALMPEDDEHIAGMASLVVDAMNGVYRYGRVGSDYISDNDLQKAREFAVRMQARVAAGEDPFHWWQMAWSPILRKRTLNAQEKAQIKETLTVEALDRLKPHFAHFGELKDAANAGPHVGEIPVHLIASAHLRECAELIAETFGGGADRITYDQVVMALKLLKPGVGAEDDAITALEAKDPLMKEIAKLKKAKAKLKGLNAELEHAQEARILAKAMLMDIEDSKSEIEAEIKTPENGLDPVAWTKLHAEIGPLKNKKSRIESTIRRLKREIREYEGVKAKKGEEKPPLEKQGLLKKIQHKISQLQEDFGGKIEKETDVADELDNSDKFVNFVDYDQQFRDDLVLQATAEHEFFLRLRASESFCHSNVQKLLWYMQTPVWDIYDAGAAQKEGQVFERLYCLGRDLSEREAMQLATCYDHILNDVEEETQETGYDWGFTYCESDTSLYMFASARADVGKLHEDVDRMFLPEWHAGTIRWESTGDLAQDKKKVEEYVLEQKGLFGAKFWRKIGEAEFIQPEEDSADKGEVVIRYERRHVDKTGKLLIRPHDAVNMIVREGIVDPFFDTVKSLVDQFKGMVNKDRQNRVKSHARDMANRVKELRKLEMQEAQEEEPESSKDKPQVVTSSPSLNATLLAAAGILSGEHLPLVAGIGTAAVATLPSLFTSIHALRVGHNLSQIRKALGEQNLRDTSHLR